MEYTTVIVVAIVVAICAFLGFLAERWSRPNCSMMTKNGSDIGHVELPSADVLAGKWRSDKTNTQRAGPKAGDDPNRLS